MSTKVLITGASSGIGALYADRFARRGHDLVLVARDKGRLDALAERLRKETKVNVEVLQADLTNAADLTQVEAKLRDDDRIDVLVNNAGATQRSGFRTTSADDLENLVQLNVTAPTRLVAAVLPRFAAKNAGSIINVASVLAVVPELGNANYSATKAYVLSLSQSLQFELRETGIYVQAVLPAATRTEIWERAGLDIAKVPGVMDVDVLVDAALVGYDRREPITIPPLPDEAQWQAFEGARKAMGSGFLNANAAKRYSNAS
jgi:short-subunit dehydrogenase